MNKAGTLEFQWIYEAEGERCLKCRQTKKGRFLIIHLDGAGIRAYVPLCEECLTKYARESDRDKRRKLSLQEKIIIFSKMCHHLFFPP